MWMLSDEEIDHALMSNITNQWRKVARVVMTTMSQLKTGRKPVLQNDLYFARRVALLADKGLIENKGDLDRMRECEVRLPFNEEKLTELTES
jgi:hypothetical protein